MKWTTEAEDAIKKVPFFVRKKVRARVEKEAHAEDKNQITLKDVELTRKRFLSNMSSEVKGYQIDTCFGTGGACPNRAVDGDGLLKRLEDLLKEEDILGFLRQHVKGDLKFHHDFRVTLADCPNACSQPQIKDIGIIGACFPEITNEGCNLCGACVEVCAEDVVKLDEQNEKPVVGFDCCLACRKCITKCLTGTLAEGRTGFRVLIGGKLGRHPKLATEINVIFTEDEVVDIVKNCIRFYKHNSRNGKRFAQIVQGEDIYAVCGLTGISS